MKMYEKELEYATQLRREANTDDELIAADLIERLVAENTALREQLKMAAETLNSIRNRAGLRADTIGEKSGTLRDIEDNASAVLVATEKLP